MHLEDLPTPCAVVDLDRVEKNVNRFSAKAKRLGVELRPHLKTHKCIEAARLQVKDHFGGITVSTLAEAQFFAEAGFSDIVYAVPIAPHRLDEVLDLAASLEHFAVLVDHPVVIRLADAAARSRGVTLGVFLEVDCGGGRSGVDPATERALEIAHQIDASPGLELRGLLTHAEHAYSCRRWQAVENVAERERSVMVDLARTLRDSGVDPGATSIGSTPTFAAIEDLAGINEVRPGNYVFFDAFQAALGSCTLDDVAFSVLATVIGHYPQRNELVIDAGALALSKDAGPTHIDPECGFGVVLTCDNVPIPGLKVVSLTQEHGLIRADDDAALAGFAPGTRLRILPNHSCLAAALHDCYHVVRGDRVIDKWRPVRGW